LNLELKLIAEVGIIGVPNAGKSTLLSVISSAHPKIANYPFTTLTPNLGVATVGDREIVFADIPGLVEGAHNGVGLGHSFLRHVQRTKVLIHVLDGTGDDPIGDFVQINTELALFDPALAAKPQIITLNKIDVPAAKALSSRIRAAIRKHGHNFHAISAVTHEGVASLLQDVTKALIALPPQAASPEVPIYKPDDEEEFHVIREGQDYRVIGKRIERAAAMTYWDYDEAVERFQRILHALGVADALVEAGVAKGDTVIIGEFELEWAE
jgi:GTP-binding protein